MDLHRVPKLRPEAITHDTKSLGVGRVLDKFGDIVARLRQIADRFDDLGITTMPAAA